MAIIMIQCLFRRIHAVNRVNELIRIKAAVALQSRMRSYLATLELDRRRRHFAALVIQKHCWQYALKRRQFSLFRRGSCVTIQRWFRLRMFIFYNKKALTIGR